MFRMSDGDAIPDDFGLGPIETLSRVADPSPAPEHSVFWSQWKASVTAARPVLTERKPGGTGVESVDPSDPSCTHAFESLGVRIGCRLILPPDEVPIRAGLVSTHGYAASGPVADRDPLFAGLAARGVAVLNIRVRGFAGSRLDTGDLTEPSGAGLGWICRGLDHGVESADAPIPGDIQHWVYPQAIADLVNGVRALRWHLQDASGQQPPLLVHGESFGGGLAVGAASRLVGRGPGLTRVARLILALPTMGDWRWRHAHAGRVGGSGGEIERLIAIADERRPGFGDVVRGRLRVCDSVVLASRVRCPALCKLAERDQVVPAPTAAAVFNALGVDPGRKWRFVVPHGHAETGLSNARKHAEFQRAAEWFCDPGRAPAEAIAAYARDVAGEPAEKSKRAAVDSGPGLFGGIEPPEGPEQVLCAAYASAGRTLDDLPYTPEFEELWTSVAKAVNLDRRGVLHRLQNLRKAGKLPKLGRAATGAVAVEPDEEATLTALVTEHAGSLGARDALPYTDGFEAVYAAFCERTSRQLTQHDLWRLIAKVCK